MNETPVDIAILLGSQSNDIFEVQLDAYPGALKLSNLINGFKCTCGDPRSCSRRAFQLVVGQASNGDPTIAEKFIAEASGTCHTHYEVRELMVKYYEEYAPKEPEELIIEVHSQEELDGLLKGLLGSRTVN